MTVHLQQLKGMQNSKQGMGKGVPFVNRRYTKGVSFLFCQRVSGWTSGRSLPVRKWVEYTPPPPSLLGWKLLVDFRRSQSLSKLQKDRLKFILILFKSPCSSFKEILPTVLELKWKKVEVCRCIRVRAKILQNKVSSSAKAIVDSASLFSNSSSQSIYLFQNLTQRLSSPSSEVKLFEAWFFQKLYD